MTDKEKALTPKLRFPKFKDGPGWNRQLLGDLFTERQESSQEDLSLLSLTDKDGIVPQVETKRRDNSSLDKSKYLRVVPGDIAYNTMRMWEGRSAFVDMEGVVSPAYTVCKPKADTDGLFFSYYFKTQPLIGQFKRYSQGLVKDTLNLKFEAFARITVPSPQLQEQEKIARCLTSLDELINAEGRKLEAMRGHKAGLMQELFPLKGETLPRLRFPEFRDATEWVETLLECVIEVASGQVDPTEPPYCDLPHVGGENIESESGNIRGLRSAREDAVISGKYPFDERDVLYSKIRPALNKVAAPDFRGICSADIYPIRPSSHKLLRGYLVYLLRSKSFVDYAKKHSARGKIPKINRETLLSYSALIPSPVEQRRIVACLASLDTLIAAASRKLDGLLAHKRGMMQQLFPVPNRSNS